MRSAIRILSTILLAITLASSGVVGSDVRANEALADAAKEAIAQRARAEQIAFDIFSANQEICRYRRLDPGFSTHTLKNYSRHLRSALKDLSVSNDPSVGSIYRKDLSPQVRPGEMIRAEDGTALASWDRQTTYQLLKGHLLIDGERKTVSSQPVCALHLQRDKRSGLQARTDGRTVTLSDATLRLQPDDALAFVIAHELGHVLLGHTRNDWNGSEDKEVAADRAALYLMSNAGYDPRKALDTLDKMKSPLNDLAAFFSTEKSSKSRHRLIQAYLSDNAQELTQPGLKYPPRLDPLLSHLSSPAVNRG